MSNPAFTVLTTPRFDRLLRSLSRRHPDFAERFAAAVAILSVDPYNRNRELPSGNWRAFVNGKASTGFDSVTNFAFRKGGTP